MKEEVSLIVVMVFLLLFDLFATGKIRRYFHLIACVALGGHLLYNLQPLAEAKAFGGMYVNSPVISLVKSVLEAGALIVFMQAGNWLAGEKASIKRGEFYVLMLSTLLGMFFMLSSGNFLLFLSGWKRLPYRWLLWWLLISTDRMQRKRGLSIFFRRCLLPG